MADNTQRIHELMQRRLLTPQFSVGQQVIDLDDDTPGLVDAVFIDLQAAVECGVVDASWYDALDYNRKGYKNDPWYSVIFQDGASLIHAQNLRSIS